MDKKQKYILFAILLVLLVVAMVVIIVKNRTVSVAKTSDVDYHAENEPVAQTGEIPEEPKEDVHINMSVIGDIMCHNTQYNDAYNSKTGTSPFAKLIS